MVDAWQLENWEAYRDVMRLGRKTRLAETPARRALVHFSKVQDGLVDRRLLTEPRMFRSPPQVKAIRVCLYAPEMPTASHPFSIRLWELMRDFLG